MIFAGTRGYLDPIPVSAVAKFEQSLLRGLRVDEKTFSSDDRRQKGPFGRHGEEAGRVPRQVREGVSRLNRVRLKEQRLMASLKEMRNRIASVKATRKITKAMQMVAAAKLRRAQEAARPRGPTPSAWNGARQPRLERRRQRRRVAAARRHRQGRGAPADRHDGRARSVRRLQFQHRQARPRRCAAADRRGQDGQDHDGRPQGRRQPAPRPRQALSSIASIFAGRAPAHLRPRRRHRPEKSSTMFEAGEFDVATLYFSRVQVGHLADADGAAAHSGKDRDGQAPKRPAAPSPSTSTSRAKRTCSATSVTLNISTQIFRGLLENGASFYGAQMSAMD